MYMTSVIESFIAYPTNNIKIDNYFVATTLHPQLFALRSSKC